MSVSLPTNYRIRSAQAGYARSQGVSVCPYSQQRLVQDWGGKAKRIQIEVPPISSTEAANWSQFFDDLNGMAETFVLDVTDLYPHEPGATAVTFRMDDPNFSYDINVAKHFGFTFTATEVV